MSQLDRTRRGSFTIPLSVIEDAPYAVKWIMAECIIIRAEYRLATREVHYDAYCDAFESVEDMVQSPDYDISFDEESKTVTWTKAS